MPLCKPQKNPVFSSIHQGNVEKNSSFASSIKGRRGSSRILDLCGTLSCFCRGQTSSERKLGKEPPLSLSLSLHHLYFSIISSSPFLYLSFLSSCVYLYDFLAKRLGSHPVFGYFFLLASALSEPSSSSSGYFFGLRKMMKKKIRVSVDPAPSTSFLVGEEARARFKHQCLLQDYQELLKETEGKKGRLNMALQRKLKLLAEVKFLSQKYQSLSNIPQAKPCRVKKQSCKEVTQPSHPVIETKPLFKERNLKSKEVSVQSSPKLADLNQFKVPSKDRNRKAKEASVQSAPKLLDLNQVSLPNGEEMELEVNWEPLKIEKLKRSLIEGDTMVDDIKFSICRDIGSSQSGWGIGKLHGKISSL